MTERSCHHQGFDAEIHIYREGETGGEGFWVDDQSGEACPFHRLLMGDFGELSKQGLRSGGKVLEGSVANVASTVHSLQILNHMSVMVARKRIISGPRFSPVRGRNWLRPKHILTYAAEGHVEGGGLFDEANTPLLNGVKDTHHTRDQTRS